jgi:hypothetical protein
MKTEPWERRLDRSQMSHAQALKKEEMVARQQGIQDK